MLEPTTKDEKAEGEKAPLGLPPRRPLSSGPGSQSAAPAPCGGVDGSARAAVHEDEDDDGYHTAADEEEKDEGRDRRIHSTSSGSSDTREAREAREVGVMACGSRDGNVINGDRGENGADVRLATRRASPWCSWKQRE
ncbi:unnamed protein product [Pylaiella littoralis]